MAEGGPFVLPPMLCSQRRSEYFQRANRIIATYATVTAYSGQGQKAIEAGVAAGKISDSTRIRIALGNHTFQTNYKLVRSSFAKAGAQLTNQVFLLLYGNFEAFLVDLARDACAALGSSEPLEEAVPLVAMTKWKGKLDRIAQRFSLKLGHNRYVSAYQGIGMQFLGRTATDPIEFLQATADLRHRLVHSAGRADAQLVAEYPQSGLTEGALIELPFGLPVAMHFWFVPLTDLLTRRSAPDSAGQGKRHLLTNLLMRTCASRDGGVDRRTTACTQRPSTEGRTERYCPLRPSVWHKVGHREKEKFHATTD